MFDTQGFARDVQGFEMELRPEEIRQLAERGLDFDGENDAVVIDIGEHGNHGRMVGSPQFVVDKSHPLAHGMIGFGR